MAPHVVQIAKERRVADNPCSERIALIEYKMEVLAHYRKTFPQEAPALVSDVTGLSNDCVNYNMEFAGGMFRARSGATDHEVRKAKDRTRTLINWRAHKDAAWAAANNVDDDDEVRRVRNQESGDREKRETASRDSSAKLERENFGRGHGKFSASYSKWRTVRIR